VTVGDRYLTPAAFRRALTDMLRESAKTSPWSVRQLQRQVAYDRFLERLYLVDDGWIVKGATALLARDLGVRGSLDVDIYRAVAQEIAEADVRTAAALDICDWFRFETGPAHPIGNKSVRLPVNAIIGTTTWVVFHIDLSGTDLRMTGRPEDVPPVARAIIPEVEQRGYRAYPLADHVADKVAATYERHGELGNPSTRYRDLVDLVAIAGGATLQAGAQRIALQSEFERRSLALPESFNIPDRSLWKEGYAAEVRRSILETAQTLDEALEIVRGFLDPIFRGRTTGIWVPTDQLWSDSQ
jgi:Nucleotidyl transferase AbiEii toxin, Type IV TA system